MKLMWTSVAPYVPSGYGTTTRNTVSRLIKKGWNVAVYGIYGHGGSPITVDGIKVYSSANSPAQTPAHLVECCKDFDADTMIVHHNIWQYPWLSSISDRIIGFIPVDRNPIHPDALKIYRGLWKNVSQSDWGRQVLLKYGINAPVIPGGVDTQTFKPVSVVNRNRIRAEMGIPEDAFLISSIGVNSGPRKQFHRLIPAFERFAKANPNAHLYLHTHPTGNVPEAPGYDLPAIAQSIGIKDRVHFPTMPSWGVSDNLLSLMYAASDVYINVSSRGGFEIPIIEAMACGIPVITQNFGPMGDLISPIAPELLLKPLELVPDGQSGIEAIPSGNEILRVLTLAEKRIWDNNLFVSRAKDFDYDTVIIPHWEEYLKKVSI